MNSDDDADHENDRAKLLTTSSEQTKKLHKDVGKFVYPHSDTESQYTENIEMSENERDSNKNRQASPYAKISRTNVLPGIPKRFIVLALLTLGNFNMYCIRMCLSVAIVAMAGENTTVSSKAPEFHWSKEFRGTILASLYWGYTTMQIPAGLLSFKLGGTYLLGIAIFGSSALTLVTPFIVRQNVYAFIVLRVLEGAFLGLVGASGFTIVSKWSPIYERSIFLTFCNAGLLFGTVFANSLSGVLAGSAWGWPSVFYFFGVLGVLWYLFWIYFVYEEPSDHPNITQEELKLIGKHWSSKRLLFKEIPWRYILTSLPVWALIIINFTDCWGFYTFIISFPSYLNDVLKYEVTKVGFASSLPYLICGVLAPLWGYIVDYLRSKKYISTIFARKLSSFIGTGVSALFVIGIGHTTTSASGMIISTIAISITAISSAGPSVNIVEIAPKYSGILMGIINFSCNITGFICPQVVGTLTGHGEARHQWAVVFYITGAISIFGMVIYCCLASSEKQAWAEH